MRSRNVRVPSPPAICAYECGSGRLYTYPDVIVFCGEPKWPISMMTSLLNPTVIAEVLSPSTEAYDRGFKSRALSDHRIPTRIRLGVAIRASSRGVPAPVRRPMAAFGIHGVGGRLQIRKPGLHGGTIRHLSQVSFIRTKPGTRVP